MPPKESTDKLIGVPQTMLLPLYARAIETQRPNGMVNDIQAVTMMAQIDYEFDKFADDIGTNLGVAIRTEILDELAITFIKKYPNALIVNIAAGLDTRFSRVDNGQIMWVDLDLPESIEMRKKFITPSERNPFIAQSVLDFGWIDNLPEREHTLFIIEGLFMYLTESDVKKVLTTIADKFTNAELLCEVMGVTLAKDTSRNTAIARTGAQFKWGIRDASAMATWHERINYITDISIYDRHQTRWEETGFTFPAPLHKLRTAVNRIVHLHFA